MGVTPFGKVSLEGFGTLVGEVAADLAVVRDVEAVEFVEPVGNGFAVPTQGKVLRVVRDVVVFLGLRLEAKSI